MSDKSSKKVKKEAAETMTGLQRIANLPSLAKNKGGAPTKKEIESREVELSNKDLELLSVLMATNGNKALTARITGVDRKKLYRLLNSERVTRLTQMAELRLKALIEAAVVILEKAIVEDGNVEIAMDLVKGLIMKKWRKGGTERPGTRGRRMTAEEWITEDNQAKSKNIVEED